MTSPNESPELLPLLKELRAEVRILRYLFSISIIILSLVLMFVTPIVIRYFVQNSGAGQTDSYTGFNDQNHIQRVMGTASGAASTTMPMIKAKTASTTPSTSLK